MRNADFPASPRPPGRCRICRGSSRSRVGAQRIHVGLPHAGKTAKITVGADTYQITVEDAITLAAPRRTSRDIKRHKASSYPEPGTPAPPNP
jgi:hypothetical protein